MQGEGLYLVNETAQNLKDIFRARFSQSIARPVFLLPEAPCITFLSPTNLRTFASTMHTSLARVGKSQELPEDFHSVQANKEGLFRRDHVRND